MSLATINFLACTACLNTVYIWSWPTLHIHKHLQKHTNHNIACPPTSDKHELKAYNARAFHQTCLPLHVLSITSTHQCKCLQLHMPTIARAFHYKYTPFASAYNCMCLPLHVLSITSTHPCKCLQMHVPTIARASITSRLVLRLSDGTVHWVRYGPFFCKRRRISEF